MLVAIISDSHDNLDNLKKFLDWSLENKIEKIICLGDVCKIESIKYLAHNFLREIFLVRGNACLYDEKDLKKYKNIKYYGEVGEIEIEGLKIAFTHEPEKIKKANLLKLDSDKQNLNELSLNKLAPNNMPPDFIFYGHTHKPWLKKEGETFIANPGTLGGIYYQATFAVLDTKSKNLELKILEGLE